MNVGDVLRFSQVFAVAESASSGVVVIRTAKDSAMSASFTKRGMASSSAGYKQARYIYELPYAERDKLCRLLDAGGRWKELGLHYMNMDHIAVSLMEQAVLRKGSPTDELLHKWGEKNGTINQLFVYLYKMKHMQAMVIIKDFVNPKYHSLLERQQTTELDSALLCSSFSMHSARFPECSAPPQSSMGAAYNKKHYLEDCNMNLNESYLQGKVDSGKVKMLSSGLPGKSNRSRQLVPQNNLPSMSNNCFVNANNLYPELPRLPASSNKDSSSSEGKVQNIGSKQHSGTPDSPRRNTVVGAKKDSGEVQPIVNTISYTELLTATEGFLESNILGRGGFGTVYKGCWKDTTVAIKRLHLREKDADIRQDQNLKQSLTELKVLQSFRIDNILPLYGVSLDGPEPCLVYQYMKNGSLEDRLRCKHKTPPLNWTQRNIIAKGTARGLHFLHTSIKGQPLIHGDIKSANILLDSNLEPKIGDFGLTREGPPTELTHIVVSHVHGTKYYLPHEYLKSRQLSTKVDIYSYGIVLLELATSKHVFDKRRKSKALIDHVADCARSNQLDSLRDAGAGNENSVVFHLLIHLGQKCSSPERKERPEMEEVLQQFRENPTEAVRRLSQCTFPSCSPQPGSQSPSPLDIQLWYDIRQAAMQSTRPTFLTPNTTPLSTAPTVPPTSPRLSPTLPGRMAPSPTSPAVASSGAMPSAIVSPTAVPSASLASVPPATERPIIPLAVPEPLHSPRRMSPPGFLLPRISELGVSFISEEQESKRTEHSHHSELSGTNSDNAESDNSTADDSGKIFSDPRLLKCSLELPDLDNLEISSVELLED